MDVGPTACLPLHRFKRCRWVTNVNILAGFKPSLLARNASGDVTTNATATAEWWWHARDDESHDAGARR